MKPSYDQKKRKSDLIYGQAKWHFSLELCPVFIIVTALVLAVTHAVAQPVINNPKDNDSAKLPTSATVSVIEYGAKGDGVQNDAIAIQKALDSGASVVTIPQGIYSIDRTLKMGSGVTLKVDPQSVIRLTDRAGNNVSVFLLTNRNPGNGNSNIMVEGGIWDGNNEHNIRGKDGDFYGYTGTAINFINVRNLTLRKFTVRNPDAFSIRVGEVQDFLIEDVVLDHSVIRHNQDGIHIGGFSHRGIIRRIRAIHPNTPNDDMIAINADDDVERVVNLGMRCGPIHDILVEDIQAEGAYNFVRLLSKESLIENITVRRVRGSCRYYAVNMNNWRFPAGSGDIRNILLEQFDISKILMKPDKKSLFHITENVHDLHIYNIRLNDNPDNSPVPTLLLNNQHTNTVQGGDGQQTNETMYVIPKGGIQELWINRYPIKLP